MSVKLTRLGRACLIRYRNMLCLMLSRHSWVFERLQIIINHNWWFEADVRHPTQTVSTMMVDNNTLTHFCC